MSNSFFKFKQFTIHHDRCAMKVGTDGVLLGAWTPVEGVRQILDVGTGTGLIALQLSQRNAEAYTTAVEIDPVAAEQARENVTASPWAERIEVVCTDFGNYHPDRKFDLIVSNPPYFVDALKCPDRQRNTARHTDSLSYEQLFAHAAMLLAEWGKVCVIVPAEVEQEVIDAAWRHHLNLVRRMRVYTKPGKPCRRVMMSLAFTTEPCHEETLCIEHEHHHYTPEYIALTRDFYLNL